MEDILGLGSKLEDNADTVYLPMSKARTLIKAFFLFLFLFFFIRFFFFFLKKYNS